MPAFFVHGIPKTHHLWIPMIERLARNDVVVVDLPGLGCSVPDGFDASKEAYVDWLIARIEREGRPVDLVAHDWGCILAMRVASLRPDFIRSWAGGGGAIDAGMNGIRSPRHGKRTSRVRPASTGLMWRR